MSTVGELIGVKPEARKVPWSYKDVSLVKIPSDEIIGIEVEVENTNFLADIRRPWNVKEDGSLRNSGRELVSDPIAASSAPAALYHLLVQGLDPVCSFSMRTSIHIHINATDMNEAQIRDFVALYTIFEPALFNFAGRGRWKSVFCVPLNECQQIANVLSRKLTDGRWEKYTSLNLRRLADLGTIEFRHMGGTFDVDRVCNWIGMICRLKQYVMQVGSKDIRQELASMGPYYNYAELCNRVFGEFSPLLKVSDNTAYYAASLTARVAVIGKPEVIDPAPSSPIVNFIINSKRSA